MKKIKEDYIEKRYVIKSIGRTSEK